MMSIQQQKAGSVCAMLQNCALIMANVFKIQYLNVQFLQQSLWK